MIKDKQDPTKPNVVSLNKFQFKKPKLIKKDKNKPTKPEVAISISWRETDKNGNEFENYIEYNDIMDSYYELRTETKKIFTEKCFKLMGYWSYIDPYYARELEEKLKELYENDTK